MVQGQPDGWSVRPIQKRRFDLSLVQGAKSQGIELPCNAEGDNSVPSPCQPSHTAVLVAVAGPKGE
eukprot:9981468-Alexandrium_andersonii.AAC.1